MIFFITRFVLTILTIGFLYWWIYITYLGLKEFFTNKFKKTSSTNSKKTKTSKKKDNNNGN